MVFKHIIKFLYFRWFTFYFKTKIVKFWITLYLSTQGSQQSYRKQWNEFWIQICGKFYQIFTKCCQNRELHSQHKYDYSLNSHSPNLYNPKFVGKKNVFSHATNKFDRAHNLTLRTLFHSEKKPTVPVYELTGFPTTNDHKIPPTRILTARMKCTEFHLCKRWKTR